MKREQVVGIKFATIVAVVVVLVSMAAFGQAAPEKAKPVTQTQQASAPGVEAKSETVYEAGVPGGTIVNTLEIKATITAIDKATRQITLKTEDGQSDVVTASPEIKNFDQLKTGDVVKFTVTEQLVVKLDEKAAAKGDSETAEIKTAPKGAMPGGVAAKTIQMVGTITAIDMTRRTATVLFEDGSSELFPVRSDVDLSKRKVGEKLTFTVTQMIAVKVERP